MSRSESAGSSEPGKKPARSSLEIYSHPAVDQGRQYVVSENQLQLLDPLTLFSMRRTSLQRLENSLKGGASRMSRSRSGDSAGTQEKLGL